MFYLYHFNFKTINLNSNEFFLWLNFYFTVIKIVFWIFSKRFIIIYLISIYIFINC